MTLADRIHEESKLTTSELRDRIVTILADILQEEVGSEDGRIERAALSEWDSVNHFRLVVELEDAFSIMIADDEALSICSVADIEELLVRRGVNRWRPAIG